MRLTLTMLTFVLAGLMCGPRVVWGQFGSSSSGQSGMFGNRSLGSSLSAGQGSAFGSSSSVGGPSGLSGGSMGFGAQTGRQGSIGQGGAANTAGQARRAGDFVGATAQQLAGSGFVGAAQAETGSGQGYGGGGYGGNRFSSMLSSEFGQSRMGQWGGMGGAGLFGGRATSNAAAIRTVLTVGFDAPAVNSQKVSSTLAKRLSGLPALHWRSPCQVEIRGRTTILQGTVATQHDRDLAERVARLEATVEQVQNRIAVAADSK
jgi:hypothetical protein